MSKDFKKDYQEELQLEIPDLWDRIEAELPPKETAPQLHKTTPQLQTMVGRPTIRKKRSRKFRRMRNIAVTAAACLCVAITGVAFFSNMGARKSEAPSAMMEMAAADSASAEMAEEAVEECAPIEESYMEAAASDEMAPAAVTKDGVGIMADNGEDMLEETAGASLNEDDSLEAAEGEIKVASEEESIEGIEEDANSIGDANVVEVLNKPGHVNAKAGILIDATTGQILFEQDAETALPPASTTKMMTALLTVEAIERGELSLDQVVTVDNHARNITPVGGSVLALPIEEGEEVSIKDLLYAVLLKSDCVCCNILAEQVCGDVEVFVERMNERAKELGCTNTIFLNTHGYKEKGHLISAHDLALIAAEAMTHPAFYEIVNTDEYVIPETNINEAREIRNTNWLLGTMWDRNVKQYNKDYEYPYAHGVKTGYTAEAGHCLVSYAKKDDKELVCVILGAEIDTDEESGYLVQHMYEDTIKLYNWGFGAYERGEIVQDATSSLIDLGEVVEEPEVMEEETQSIEEETLQPETQEPEEDTAVSENGSVAKTVLLVGLVAMILMLLAGVAFIIYRRFYYFD